MSAPSAFPAKKLLLSILTVESAKDLLKHRSFIILIFLILVADRFLHQQFSNSEIKAALSFSSWQDRLPQIIFHDLPVFIGDWLFQPITLAVFAGLFLFKQVVSLWPSSSLRRWHKSSSEAGMLSSLLGLKLPQFLWDLSALAILCSLVLLWGGLNFGWCYLWWQATGASAAAWVFLLMLVLVWPVVMAGLSYSSKLAVLQNGSFKQKFGLFLNLFRVPRLFFGSWLFFLARIILEMLFVAIIPLGALLYMDNVLLRTFLACLSITPSYSYLKMASFKYFLFIYSPYPLIQEEFKDYLLALSGRTPAMPAKML